MKNIRSFIYQLQTKTVKDLHETDQLKQKNILYDVNLFRSTEDEINMRITSGLRSPPHSTWLIKKG